MALRRPEEMVRQLGRSTHVCLSGTCENMRAPIRSMATSGGDAGDTDGEGIYDELGAFQRINPG